jgi:hypothetical protein
MRSENFSGKRKFADHLREIPSCELSQAKDHYIWVLRKVLKCKALYLFLAGKTKWHISCDVSARLLSTCSEQTKTKYIMSETANTPSTATTTTGSACKAGSCANTPKPAQPQSATAQTAAPAGNKGFKRNKKQQH